MFQEAPGLPRCRASLVLTMRPPAYTGFHICVDPCSGPPAVSGFPDDHNMASGIDRLPCILQCIYHRASRVVGLPLFTQ